MIMMYGKQTLLPYVAGGEYNIENVQLVCRAVNSFRHNLTVADFIKWCKKVARNALQK